MKKSFIAKFETKFNGVRIESYYTNNKLWDMNYYTAINPTILKATNNKSK